LAIFLSAEREVLSLLVFVVLDDFSSNAFGKSARPLAGVWQNPKSKMTLKMSSLLFC
jgi:hypothetical protein